MLVKPVQLWKTQEPFHHIGYAEEVLMLKQFNRIHIRLCMLQFPHEFAWRSTEGKVTYDSPFQKSIIELSGKERRQLATFVFRLSLKGKKAVPKRVKECIGGRPYYITYCGMGLSFIWSHSIKERIIRIHSIDKSECAAAFNWPSTLRQIAV